MDKIKWCIHKKNGIELIDPSDNLRDAYLIKAEEALETLRATASRDWQLTTALINFHGSSISMQVLALFFFLSQ